MAEAAVMCRELVRSVWSDDRQALRCGACGKILAVGLRPAAPDARMPCGHCRSWNVVRMPA